MWRLVCCMALVLHFLTWFPSASRMLPPNNDVSSNRFGMYAFVGSSHAPHSSIPGRREESSKEERYRWVKKMGSRPPDCEHKCGGCKPCEAIKVLTITSHFGLHSANYEPQSWKCKCGLLFYTP